MGICRRTLCVVAGDGPDAPRTALHEIAHALDNRYRFSASRQLQDLWAWSHTWQTVPSFTRQDIVSAEYFAEMFAAYSEGPDGLEPRVREFFWSLPITD